MYWTCISFMLVMFKFIMTKKRQEKSHTHYERQSSALIVFCLFILYKHNKLALNFNLNWMF